MIQASQIWAKKVNSTGGINGHPLQLIVIDDGGDPARYRAGLQELVENKKVVAFVNNFQTVTGGSGVDYLNAKRVPVIGLTGAEMWTDQSTMFFPQLPTFRSFQKTVFGSTIQQALALGKTQYGLLTCAEAAICKLAREMARDEVPKRGMKLKYQAEVSLAQPDYTAECLSAKNAGVEVLMLYADGNSLRRLAASCARQAYRPLFGTASQALLDSMLDDPNLDGLLSVSSTAPWFQEGTPATDEFRAVMKQYGVSTPTGVQALGWAGMEILRKALANVPEPPTTAAVLNGLYAIHNDDFGGLTVPITFTRDQLANPPVCWWNVSIRDGAWVSPNGFKLSCD